MTVLSFLVLTTTHAGTHLFSFTPLTDNHISVPVNGVRIVKYQVMNHSKKMHTLIMRPITGISQIRGQENCPELLTLGSQQSCILSLQINGNALQGNIDAGPQICEQGNSLMCYQPNHQNRLNITQGVPEYTISGTITGLTGTLTLLNKGANAISRSTDGSFTFSIPIVQGGTYQVTVGTQPLHQTCTVASGSGTISGANVTNVTVTCSTNSYTVGGMITGLTGTLTLLNNDANSTPISTNEAFSFSTPIAEGSTYSVTVETQPLHQTCTVASGSGTMGSANVTDVSVACSTHTHTVSGTITGLTGTVTLLNNGVNPTSMNIDGSFTFSSPIAEGSSYTVTVGTQPLEQTCTVTNASGTINSSDVTNVTVNCVINNTALAVSARGTIPVNSGSGSITVNNTGSSTAFNVHAVLPGGWTGVTQNASGCATIAPHSSCTLQFTSTTPYVAQGNIAITGDNISSPPKTALAFTMNNYLIWSVSGNTALVVASSDILNYPWSVGYNILNISETSTSPPNACNGATDGFCNSNQLEALYGASYTNYAAGMCYEINSDNSGSVLPGTWFLPAICQIGNESATCAAAGLANIDTNLFKLGFGGFSSGYSYWSSTEYSGGPDTNAWVHIFEYGTSRQVYTDKTGSSYRFVRCARAITF